MAFNLAPLPFDMQALLPVISQETLEYHYGKHHLGYLNRLNQLVAGTPWETAESVVEVVRGSYGQTGQEAIFENAAQCWNHTFYWKSLADSENDRVVPQALLQMIERDFGGWIEFRNQFLALGQRHFGSGWLWLVHDDASLKLVATSNAQNPLTQPGQLPLLVCDLWEHAYYLDYRNRRADYLDRVFTILNWRFAGQQLAMIGHE